MAVAAAHDVGHRRIAVTGAARYLLYGLQIEPAPPRARKSEDKSMDTIAETASLSPEFQAI